MRWFVVGCVTSIALTGCADFIGGAQPETVNAFPLLGGEVIAKAPAGYCIAPAASRPNAGFAVVTRCAGDAAQAVMTIQVGGMGTGLTSEDARALEALLRSDAGRGLLSASSDPNAISVDRTEVADTTVIVHFDDMGPPAIIGTDTAEWRGFFNLNGRLTTVAVRGLATAPLGTDEGEVLLARLIAAMNTVARPTDV